MKKDFIRSFLIYSIGDGLSKIVPLLLLPVFTKIFSPEEYGVIEMINTIVIVVAVFGMLQLDTALQRYYYKEKKDRKKIISTIFWSVLILSLLFSIIVTVFSEYLSETFLKSAGYKQLMYLISVLLPLTNIDILFSIIIRYNKKIISYLIITFIKVALISFGALFFVIELNMGIEGMILGQVMGLMVSTIIYFILIRNSLVFNIDMKILRKGSSFALPMFPARMGAIVNTQAIKFLMLYYLSISSIGVYSVAFKISSMLTLVVTAFSLSWFPFMYENCEKNDHKNIYNRVYIYTTIGVMLISILYSFFSKEVFSFLIKRKEYGDAAYLMGGIGISILYVVMKNLLDVGPLLTKKTIYVTYSYLIVSAITIILLVVLIKPLQEKGAVLALVGSSAFSLMISFFVTQKLYPMPYSKFLLILTFMVSFFSMLINMFWDIFLLYKIVFCFLLLSFFTVILIKEFDDIKLLLIKSKNI